MKKRSFYVTAIVAIQILCTLSTFVEAREKSRFHKADSRHRKIITSSLLQNRQSDTWDYINLEILVAPEYYIEPPFEAGFELNTFSDWSMYDDWLALTVAYESEYLDFYQFDSQGQLTQMIEQEWNEDDEEWINYFRMIPTYEPNAGLIKILEQDWDTGHRAWLDYYKKDFTYGAAGKPDSLLCYEWYPASDIWGVELKSTFTYNSDGQLIERIEYEYDDPAWYEWYKNVYTYNSNGDIAENIYQEWDDGLNAWENSSKFTTVYNSDNLPTESYDFSWDVITQQWINDYHSLYTFTNTLWTEWVDQIWDKNASSWMNYTKDDFSYNAKGDLDSFVSSYWDSATGAWENGEKYSMLYNLKGNPATVKFFEWDPGTSAWINYDGDMTIKYNYTSAIKQKQMLSNRAPAICITGRKKVLNIKLEGQPGAHDGMGIYDLQGRLIHTAKPVMKGNETVYTWDRAQATAHQVYVLSVKHKGEMLTQRLVLE